MTTTLLYLEFNNSEHQKTEAVNAPIDDKKTENNAEIQTINFCQLSTNPTEYDGKIIRLSADIMLGTEGAWFTDSNCSTSQITTLIFGNEAAWKPIDEARKQKNKKLWTNELTITVIGTFKNQDPKNCCIIASSQFEIQRVENAVAKPN